MIFVFKTYRLNLYYPLVLINLYALCRKISRSLLCMPGNFSGFCCCLTFFKNLLFRERSGSVKECLTLDRGAVGSSLTGVTALWSLSKTNLSLLVQLRKTHPCLTERLLMGRKESNQTKQTIKKFTFSKYYQNYLDQTICKGQRSCC